MLSRCALCVREVVVVVGVVIVIDGEQIEKEKNKNLTLTLTCRTVHVVLCRYFTLDFGLYLL